MTWADHYLISYEKVDQSPAWGPRTDWSVCLQDERQQNERLRRAAQQSLANSGRIPSEANIKGWLRENRERKLLEFQADYARDKRHQSEASSIAQGEGKGKS